jgi:hypothetical protein
MVARGEKKSFQPHYVPEVESASNRNEHQEYSWNILGYRAASV